MFDARGNPLTVEEFGEVITNAFAAEGSLSSSDSNKTIRGRDRRNNERTTESTKSSPASRLKEPHARASTESSVADELITETNSSTGSSISTESSLSVHPAEPENPLASAGTWQIQYSKIPGSSELSCGPVSPNRILKRLEGRQELVCRFSLP
jgi:hypothetical protein